MKEMTAENATFLLHGVYLPALKNESQLTKSVIAAVPADKAEYRPDPVSKNANRTGPPHRRGRCALRGYGD